MGRWPSLGLWVLAACAQPGAPPLVHPDPAQAWQALATRETWGDRHAVVHCDDAPNPRPDELRSDAAMDAGGAVASADGRLIAMGSPAGISFFDGATLAWIGRRHGTGACAATKVSALSHDGRYMVASGSEQLVWDLSTDTAVFALSDSDVVLELSDRTLSVLQPRGFAFVTASASQEETEITDILAASSDGRLLVSSNDARSMVLDLAQASAVVLDVEGSVHNPRFVAGDAKLVTATSAEGELHIDVFRVRDGARLSRRTHRDAMRAPPTLSRDERWYAILMRDRANAFALVCDLSSQAPCRTSPLDAHAAALVPSPSGGFTLIDDRGMPQALSMSADGTLTRAAASARAAPPAPLALVQAGSSARVSADGTRVGLFRSWDTPAFVWELGAALRVRKVELMAQPYDRETFARFADVFFPALRGAVGTQAIYKRDETGTLIHPLKTAHPCVLHANGPTAAFSVLCEQHARRPWLPCQGPDPGGRLDLFTLAGFGPFHSATEARVVPFMHALSPDGKLAVSHTCAGVFLHRATAPAERGTRLARHAVTPEARFSPDGRYLALRNPLRADGPLEPAPPALHLFRLNGTRAEPLPPTDGEGQHFLFASVGDRIAIGGEHMRVFDLRSNTKTLLGFKHMAKRPALRPLAFSADGQSVVAYDHVGGALHVWGPRDVEALRSESMPAPHAAAFTADGAALVVIAEHSIELLRIGDGERVTVRTFEDERDVYALAEHSSGLFTGTSALLPFRAYRDGPIFGGRVWSEEEIRARYERADLIARLFTGLPLQ